MTPRLKHTIAFLLPRVNWNLSLSSVFWWQCDVELLFLGNASINTKSNGRSLPTLMKDLVLNIEAWIWLFSLPSSLAFKLLRVWWYWGRVQINLKEGSNYQALLRCSFEVLHRKALLSFAVKPLIVLSFRWDVCGLKFRAAVVHENTPFVGTLSPGRFSALCIQSLRNRGP